MKWFKDMKNRKKGLFVSQSITERDESIIRDINTFYYV